MLRWNVTGATATDGSGSMNGTALNFGCNIIKWTVTDGCNNSSKCSFIIVMPNPSSTNFRIAITSDNAKDPVQMIVTDMLGRIIESRKITAGQVITIGDNYRNGSYAVRILQGKKIRQLTLIKISD